MKKIVSEYHQQRVNLNEKLSSILDQSEFEGLLTPEELEKLEQIYDRITIEILLLKKLLEEK